MTFQSSKLSSDIGKIKTPGNLEELIGLLAREVIRSQPSDIPAFISNLLSKMVSLRDGELSVDSISEPWIKFYNPENFTYEHQNE